MVVIVLGGLAEQEVPKGRRGMQTVVGCRLTVDGRQKTNYLGENFVPNEKVAPQFANANEEATS